MRDLGYIDGPNFSIEGRFADGKLELLPSLARELLSLHPDVLLVATRPAILAAKAATSTTPIVMVAVADPVGAGLVASLARPGGNIYGTSLSDQYRQTAAYVHKILTGAKAADLPVEQASKFELVVNLRTAKALGLTMPQSVLARVDRVIE